ncbi:MAG: hypothetical protein ACE5F6_13410 [Anaerolineae bacterium]
MSEEPPVFITIVDNAGREKRQRVEYEVSDVHGETVYITSDGLKYIRDSLWVKRRQRFLLDELDRIPDTISRADIVIWDPMASDDTLIYYKRLYIASEHRHWLVAAVVKLRQGLKFLYNFHLQESGKVKGYHLDVPPEVWYLNPQRRKRTFGL